MGSMAVLEFHLRADSAVMHTCFGLGCVTLRAWRPWGPPYSYPVIHGNYVSGSRSPTAPKGC